MTPNPYPYLLSHSFGPMFNALFFAVIGLLAIWTLIWKGIALWHAARNKQKVWYVVLLIVNTLGILEILYILFFRKDKNASTPSAPVATPPATPSVEAPMPPMTSGQ